MGRIQALRKKFSFFAFKNKTSTLVAVLSLCLSGMAYGLDEKHSSVQGYFSLFSGVNWESFGENYLYYINNSTTRLFVPANGYTTGPITGVDVGAEWSLHDHLQGSIRLGIELSNTKVSSAYGLIKPQWPTSTNLETLNYNFSVQSIPLFVVSQLTFKSYEHWQPYILGGLGVSWNSASNYNEIATVGAGTAMPWRSMFQDYTSRELAYTAGVGMDFPVFQHLGAVGVEYRYTHYGVAQFKSPKNVNGVAPQTSYLGLGQVQSNAILLRLTVNWK